MATRRESTWLVFRPHSVPDGAGGQKLQIVQTARLRGDVRELIGRELIEAQQAGAEHTHTGWFHPRVDVRRNDELRSFDDSDVRLQVLSVAETFPSTRTRVLARRIEAGE